MKYFTSVPDVGDVCPNCHRKMFPPPAQVDVKLTIYECTECGQIIAVPSDGVVACNGRRGVPHPLAALRVADKRTPKRMPKLVRGAT
jgi:hypothetical protein